MAGKAVYRNGRKALFNPDKNVYTFIESDEPRSM
jgi:hypothetical protein